jgi:hypothetical protein
VFYPVVLLPALVFALPAYADGLDLAYFTRIEGEHSTMGIIGLMILLMIANYALNFLVIGLPALKAGPTTIRSVSFGLVLLTLLGQVADRLGAILAFIVVLPGILNPPLTNPWAFLGPLAFLGPWSLLCLNFLFSGIAVGGLAFYFLRRWWHVASRPAWIIAVGAAILTNPTWVLAINIARH